MDIMSCIDSHLFADACAAVCWRLVAHTAPPSPPQSRVLLNRHHLLGPLPPAHPPASLDVSPTSAAAEHTNLTDRREECAAGGNPDEDHHFHANGRDDVDVGSVLVDGLFEDGPHSCRDAGCDGGTQGGEEGEEGDGNGAKFAVDCKGAEEDGDEGGEC